MRIKKLLTLGMMTLSMSWLLTSCDDYFETDPDNTINEDDYIAEEDEMYKGFLGIFNKMQEAGTQAIYLTDTRAALLETTNNAPTELKSIYNYNSTDGNPYADPTCYYAIVVACNDYIYKMEQFKEDVGGMTEIAEENYPMLISSALRIKAWAYLMLGRIYGEAYWFDDPLTEKIPLTDTSVFTHCNMKELADKAIDLLENGITINGEQISADQEVAWYKWLDPETQDQTLYTKYEFLVPPSIILDAEFRSWRASYVDESAAQADWQWIRDNILDWLYALNTNAITSKYITDTSRASFVFQLTKIMQSDATEPYFKIFYTENIGLESQVISCIMYDYANHQTNTLVQYFCPEYPDAESFYLQPSEYGMALYNESDLRGPTQKWVINNLGGQDCVSKYYYGYNFNERVYEYLDKIAIYKLQPSIPTFRGHDLHFLLAEAETHLGHYTQAYYILNSGISAPFPSNVYTVDDEAGWDARYEPWVTAPNGGYANLGIAGTAVATLHDLPKPGDDDFDSYTTDQLCEMYDWALADEHMKEYIAEGKSYSYMCKIAERYANSQYRNGSQDKARDSVAVRLAPKYATKGLEQKVSSSIKSDGYFINWTLSEL